MLINSGIYRDSLAKLNYNLQSDIDCDQTKFFLIEGENGVGKSRFIEGILLKEFKKRGIKQLYFGQDIENQILSFELISLVKIFIQNLKKDKSFFKTIFLNDESHSSTPLEFNQKSTLNPNNSDIKKFILKESNKYKDLDVIIFDEVDKYFSSAEEFLSFLKNIEVNTVFLISHIMDYTSLKDSKRLSLKTYEGVVNIELINS